jgi:FixJ family two-component response regulator
MASPSSLSRAADPLADAIEADHNLWDLTQPHPAQWLTVRDRAVEEAVAAGHTREAVATALGLRASDIDRILFGRKR